MDFLSVMETVTSILRAAPLMAGLWQATVLIFGLYLVILGAVIFFRRDLAMAYFSKFASTARLNAIEAVLRFWVGLGFMGAAPDIRAPGAAFAFGAVLAVTAVPMLFLPRAHGRYALWSMKLLPKILPGFGAVSILLGFVVLYAVR